MKNKKRAAQKEFNENIGAILAEAASMAPQVPEKKFMQPAIVFRKNIAPSVDEIIASRDDKDYQMVFAKTIPDEESGDFVPVTHGAYLYSDKVLTMMLANAASPEYREVIESNANDYCVTSLTYITRDALSTAYDKFKVTLSQMMNYAVSDTANCIIEYIKRTYENPENLIDAITNYFSVSSSGYHPVGPAPVLSMSQYYDIIGDGIKSDQSNGGTKGFDDACLLVFNDIVSSVFNVISSRVTYISEMFIEFMYSPSYCNDVNYASDVIVLFNSTITMAMSNISDVISRNAYSLLNDIIIATCTLYGNADINKRKGTPYPYEYGTEF